MNNKDKDAGSSIKNVEDDRREGEGSFRKNDSKRRALFSSCSLRG